MAFFVSSCVPQRLGKSSSRKCSNRHFPILAAADKRQGLPQVAICTGPSCRGKSLVTTLRAIVHDSERYINPTGCLGECGNGPNVGVDTHEPFGAHVQTHVNSLDRAVELLTRLQFQIDEQILVAAREKERGDDLMRANRDGKAAHHYEMALGHVNNCDESTKRRAQDFMVAVLCNWAQSLLNTSVHRKALTLANEAIEMQPQCVSAWKWKARAHEGVREFDMAKSSWEMWGKLSGKHEEAKKQIGRFTGWRAFRLG